MNKPMTKQEWLSYIEKTWDTAQREAWGETPRKGAGMSDREALAEQPAQQDNPHPEYCKGYAAGLEAGAISEKKSVQQQEPVAICEYCEKERQVIQAEGKPWVGLTDEELHGVIRAGGYDSMEEFARAIEAKLKEKNT